MENHTIPFNNDMIGIEKNLFFCLFCRANDMTGIEKKLFFRLFCRAVIALFCCPFEYIHIRVKTTSASLSTCHAEEKCFTINYKLHVPPQIYTYKRSGGCIYTNLT